MRSLISFFLIICTFKLFSYAHEGEDHGSTPHDQPKAIKDGKLQGSDLITYLDAGAQIQWAGHTLQRKITDTNQVVYRYSGEVKNNLFTASNDETQNYLELKIPTGGEALKAFSFNHAGESHAPVEILTPDFSKTVQISKHHELKLTWVTTPKPASLIKIIIEVEDSSENLLGRLTVSTNDDGEFNIPIQLISSLPAGSAKIAVKKIWLGEFQPSAEKKETLGVKTVVSVVGKAKVAAN